jgi:hypothetical protein
MCAFIPPDAIIRRLQVYMQLETEPKPMQPPNPLRLDYCVLIMVESQGNDKCL